MFQSNSRLNAFTFLLAVIIAIFAAVSSFAQTPTYPPQNGDPIKGGVGLYGVVPPEIVLLKVVSGHYTDIGTGSFIGKDLVLSCAHNVRDYHTKRQGKLSVYCFDGTEYTSVQVLKYDPDLDLSLIKVSGVSDKPTHKPLSIAVSVKQGDAVYSIGWNPSTSCIERYRGVMKEPYFTLIRGHMGQYISQHTSRVVQGMSGGPLVDESGQLVGVNISNSYNGTVGISTELQRVRSFIKY